MRGLEVRHAVRLSLALLALVAGGTLGPSSASAQCEPTTDCNSNGVLDSCDITFGTSDDCNANSIPDTCDIQAGSSDDCNFNGIPDECEPAPSFTVAPTGGLASAESTSIRGSVAAVGSPLDSTVGAGAGAVHVFRRVGTTWIEEGTPLIASDASAGDSFGSSVSIDGNFLAIGAPGVDTGSLTDSGAIYIFRRNPTAGWIQTAKLTITPGIDQEALGTAVALRGTRLMAGAPQTAAAGAGRAVIYSFDGLAWSIDAIVTPASNTPGANFGNSVAIGVTHAFVGAWGNSASGTPVAGDVSVYELSGTWGFTDSLIAPSPQSGALFGIELAGNDTTLAIGAPGQTAGTGATHVFEKLGGVWTHVTELASPLGVPGIGFGHDLDLAKVGDRLVIGETEASTPTLVTGNAHVYSKSAGAWTLETSVTAGSVGDEFASAVSVDGVFAIVAARSIPSAEIFWVAPDVDCNGNGIDDLCDITSGVATDCNGNSIPDSCDLASGTSGDCDGNLVPDECQLENDPTLDCNGNGVLDSCDIAGGTSLDCTLNGVPDDCDIANGTETDCLGDGIPDSCQGIVDSTLPVFVSFPANLTVSPDSGICAALVSWIEPTVTDDCAVASVTASHQLGALFPVGTTTVTYTATDVSGNSSTQSFTISVIDNIGPEFFDVPTDFTVPTTAGICSAVISWTPPTAGDGCGLVSLTSDVPNNSTRPAGATVVTYTAIDVFGNSSSASFTVTVADQTPPVIAGAPGDQTLSAGAAACGAFATWSAPGAGDNCPSPTLTADFAPGSFFPVGSTLVTYTATDGSGNSSTATFTITVVDDLAPAFVSFPADQTVVLSVGQCSAQVFWTAPTVTENCAVSSVTSNLGSGVTLPSGVYPVTYVATDNAGNSTQATFVMTVADQEAPLVSGTPANVSLTLGLGSCAAIATWTPPTASDNCAVSSLSASHLPGSAFPSGTTTVTYTATDPSGNSTVVSFDVVVTDAEAPTIPDLPTFILVGTDPGTCSATATWTEPVGADNCAIASVTSTHASGSSFPPGDTLVTYTVTDSAGNSTQGNFAVSVTDTEAPTIAGVPTTLLIDAPEGGCDAVVTWSAPTISDNCGVASSGATHLSGGLFQVGTTVVTFDATDLSGNLATATLTVVVSDVTPPSVGPIPTDLALQNDPGACNRVVTWLPPTISDGCGVINVVATHTPGSTFPIGTTTVVYTATDANLNVTTEFFTITITDSESPSLTVGADVTAPADTGVCTADLTLPTAIVSDNCGLASVVNDFTGTSDASGTYPLGTTIVTWSAIDVNGNVTSATQTVTINLPAGSDCNLNGIPDACDVLSGTSPDCNGNGVPDECDISAGTSDDLDQNGTPDECDATFMRGDSNDDGTMNIADAIYSLQNLFVGGPSPTCLDAGDVNDDGLIDISDVISSINYIFAGGQAPPAPFPSCGIDETGSDPFDCAVYAHCP
mgnify:CR=1 FL=1